MWALEIIVLYGEQGSRAEIEIRPYVKATTIYKHYITLHLRFYPWYVFTVLIIFAQQTAS